MTGSIGDASPTSCGGESPLSHGCAVGEAASGSFDPASPEPAKSFEELMAELEGLTGRLAAGDVGIEAAADLYERAEAVHAQARQRLDQVRARVERIAGVTPPHDGPPHSLSVSDEPGETGCDGAS